MTKIILTSLILICVIVIGFFVTKKMSKQKPQTQLLSYEQKKSAEQQLLEYNRRLESSAMVQLLKDNKIAELKTAIQTPKTVKDLEQMYQSALHFFQLKNVQVKLDKNTLSVFADLTNEFLLQNISTARGEKARTIVLATRTMGALPDEAFTKGKVTVLMNLIKQKNVDEQLAWILVDNLGTRADMPAEIFNKIRSNLYSKNNIAVVNAVSIVEKMQDEKKRQQIQKEIYNYFPKSNSNIKPYLLRALVAAKLEEKEVEGLAKEIMKSNDEILYEVAIDFINSKGVSKTTMPLLEKITKNVSNPIVKNRAQSLFNQVKKENTL